MFQVEPVVLANALNSTELWLNALIVPDYVGACTLQDIEAFHEALASQRGLTELRINAILLEISEEPALPTTLLRSLQQLTELRTLNIQGASEQFSQDQVLTLVSCLPHLECLATNGAGFDDRFWRHSLHFSKKSALSQDLCQEPFHGSRNPRFHSRIGAEKSRIPPRTGIYASRRQHH